MASRVQRGHHARGEHVIHELQEALLRDMGVGEEERDWLIGERAIERLEVLTEELLVVSAGKRDGKYVRIPLVRNQVLDNRIGILNLLPEN